MVPEAETFPGEFDLLRSRGGEVVVLNDVQCVEPGLRMVRVAERLPGPVRNIPNHSWELATWSN